MSVILSHIVATSLNNVIGFKGKLPWHIPKDLKYFFTKTKNKVLIMGRKSFDSLESKPLPNRLNLVLTHRKSFLEKSFLDKNLLFFSHFKKALKYAQQPEILEKYGNEIFIAGGGEIYKQTLLQMDRLYVTRIYKEYKGDAFYPEIPEKYFKLTKQEDHKGFSFLVYEKN
ncbi:MAG: dihydrofolate reductase [Bdellovibrionales bacterium]|nr:dihydrofolate reductase [Bdellovibrionales bacterium]